MAVFNSTKTSVEEKTGGPTLYTGRAAAIWFVLAVVCVGTVSLLVFYRADVEQKIDPTPDGATTAFEKSQEVEEIVIRRESRC